MGGDYLFIYTVKPGDTLTSVASSNGISVDALAADNGLDGSARLALGQALIVNPPIITHIVTEGETLSFIAAQYGTTESQLLYARSGYLHQRSSGAAREYIGQRICV